MSVIKAPVGRDLRNRATLGNDVVREVVQRIPHGDGDHDHLIVGDRRLFPHHRRLHDALTVDHGADTAIHAANTMACTNWPRSKYDSVMSSNDRYSR